MKGLTIGVVRDLGPEGAMVEPSLMAALEEMAKVLASGGAILRDVVLPASLTTYQQVTGTINASESLLDP